MKQETQKAQFTQKERENIFRHHPAISYRSCKRCGGYNTVIMEFDKFAMEITHTCSQCNDTQIQVIY